MNINIPNQITLARLAMALLFFALLGYYAPSPERAWLLDVCFWLFLVAALSDVLDGYLARTWGQVTAFGRVVDPVVDKVMVCGAFLYFASDLFHDPVSGRNLTGVAPWMVVLVLLRELLVSALRSFSEAQGNDFAANWIGKLKMFVQSATVCVVLGVLAWYPQTLSWLRVLCVWLTVIVTTMSIAGYLHRARGFILSAEALGGMPRRARTQTTAAQPTTPLPHATAGEPGA